MLCPSNVCSGRGGNLEALPEKKTVFTASVNASPSRAAAVGTGNTRREENVWETSSGKLNAKFSSIVAALFK